MTTRGREPTADGIQPAHEPAVSWPLIEGPSASATQRQTRVDLATGHIRQAIVEGRLAPGAWIRQERVAQDLGTSRLPVREALRRLDHEGLVVIVPHTGTRVAKLDRSELVELYMIREALEPLAIAESTRLMTSAQLDHLRELHATLSNESILDDPSRWAEADRRFHLESYACSAMPQLIELIQSFWNRTQQYRLAYLSTLDPQRRDALIDHVHALILDAIERHDPDDASALLRLHIRQTRITLADRPLLFEG